jgi:hypothetical protein
VADRHTDRHPSGETERGYWSLVNTAPRTDEHAVLQHRRLVDHRVVLELAAVAHPRAYARRCHPSPRCSCPPAPRPRARVPGATQTSPPRAAHRQRRQRSPELEPSPLPHVSATSDVRAATPGRARPQPRAVRAGWRLPVALPLVGTGNGVSGACGGGNAPAHVPSGGSHGFALERRPYWRGRAAGPSPRVRGRSASLSPSGRRAVPRRSRRGSRRPAMGAASALYAADVMVVTSSRSGGAPSVGAEPGLAIQNVSLHKSGRCAP